MDMDYDRKFEEMKKYIPFLESMIKRLENTSSDSNPRQAQLDKIKSLRDLLMDKKKRMKMENLLKCEQVLVNLYAKVEQRDSLPRSKKDESLKKDKCDLNLVRSKLKSVVSKLQPENVETLPEIARASETEEVCVPGSKEPALFQRRPNVPSASPLKVSPSKREESVISKRPYTRVLQSPEPNELYWSTETSSEQPLFRRRSPKKSPRKRSPTYNKKERKKSKNKFKYNQSKDLNITLNVPEDSLNSLNTKDILSRIINCSDGDVDIATLRELRTQILGELKETGTNDDISDIILKSYKNKKNKQTKGKKANNNNSEVEEGELSDSESEAIESIYGSLVVLDKNKSVSTGNKSSDTDKPRKIQICLVINSDQTKSITQEDKDSCVDISDFQTFNSHKQTKIDEESGLEDISLTSEQNDDNLNDINDDLLYNELILDRSTGFEIEMKNDVGKDQYKIDETKLVSAKTIDNQHQNENKSFENVDVTKPNFYNSLVEVNQGEPENVIKTSKESQKLEDGNTLSYSNSKLNAVGNEKTVDNPEVVIPLLEPTKPILEPSKEVSEIDILQALKKEILSETTNVLSPDRSLSDERTPLLHQPKITKVANAKEIGPKKRISIESYKAKANTSSRSCKDTVKDDILKKQSLKLTEKECERFNFLSKLTLTESSDDEEKSNLSLDDMYTDFAPKSPDHEDFADTGLKPPVIIPSDPVQTIVVGSEADVDMRNLLPSVNASDLSATPTILSVERSKANHSEKDNNKSDERVASPLVDPRIKRDIASFSNQDNTNVDVDKSPLSNFVSSTSVVHSINMDDTPASSVNSNVNRNPMMNNSVPNLNMTPIGSLNMSPNIPPLLPKIAPNITPNIAHKIPILMTPNRTPNYANMTPIGTPNMTPSRHTFNNEDHSSRKHVYAPMFSVGESRDGIDKSRDTNQMQWDTSDGRSLLWEDRNPKNCSVQREARKDIDYRDQMSNSSQRDNDYRGSHSVQRDFDYRDMRNGSVVNIHPFDQKDCDRIHFPTAPSTQFGRVECPTTPTPLFSRMNQGPPTPIPSFGRLDCPPTPTPSFGRIDCPPTPTPSFGRIDCPPTPTPSFGRLECPPTPTPSFGRLDWAPTTTASFGRLESPSTPVHPFGRSDCPLTPSHSFGRGETHPLAPNFGRSDYDKSGSRSQDPRLNRSSDYDSNQYRDDDQERAYFKEQNFYSNSYNTDHQSREHFKRYRSEQSVERNENNKTNDSMHNYRDRSFKREERDYGRPFTREYEGDRYSRNRSNRIKNYDYRNRNDSKNYDDNTHRNYQRDKNVGKAQEPASNSIKDRKVYSRSFEENKWRVNRHGGPSFTIDTNINSSFQDLNSKSKSFSNFDVRRQRASSVGRTLSSTSSTSSHETKHVFNETERKINNAKNFRRACSVGREVDDSKLDFKDVKADLKSFKYNSDFSFCKDIAKRDLTRVSTGSPINDSLRNDRKFGGLYVKSYSNCSKYSPRKNNRDPRMRRETSTDNRDSRSNSRDSKNYGIVYSNDNITKGTILGSGYGVKNYKIPKIKRPQEVIGTSITTCEAVEETLSSSKNKALETKDEDMSVKSECRIKELNNENSLGEENNTLSKITTQKGTDKLNNSDDKELSNDSEKQKVEINILAEEEDNERETSPKRKKNTRNQKQKNLQIIKSNFIRELSDDDRNKKQKEPALNNLNTTLDSLETIERRVTRSARKTLLEEPVSLELSPIRRTRKVKKSSIVDSDSDENEILMKANSEKFEQKLSLTTENEASSKEIFTVECTVSNQIDEKPNEFLDTKDNELVNIQDTPVSKLLEPSKKEADVEIDLSEKGINVKPDLDLSNKDSSKCIFEEKAKYTENAIESSLGIGDIEMFSDNIPSDPVTDNINALIEDLDHDLNSSKNNDANSNHNKEIKLETLLENSIIPDKTGKNIKENVIGKIDKPSQELNVGMPLMSSEDKIKSNSEKQFDISQESKDGSSNKCETSQESEIAHSESESDNSEIKILVSETELVTSAKSSEILNSPSRVTFVLDNNVGAEENVCSNDAIVSTSEDGNVLKSNINLTLKNPTENTNSPSTPDSTINSNVEESKSVFGVTNNSGSEINSDITSTHVNDGARRDSLEAVSSDVGRSSEIESIGRLLSILQDKTKIKELLSLLGDQSGENEKMKKKLEKLSEIVSDDESTVDNNVEKISDDVKKVGIEVDRSNQNFDSNAQDIQEKQNEHSAEINCVSSSVLKEDKQDSLITCLKKSKDETASVPKENIVITSSTVSNCEMSSAEIENKENNIKTSSEEVARTSDNVVCDEISGNINNSSSENIMKEKEMSLSAETEPEVKQLNSCDMVENNQRNIKTDHNKPLAKKAKRPKRAAKRNLKKNQTHVENKQTDETNSQPTEFPDKPGPKKLSRELQKLQEDMREMFLKDDISSATGIRMCRIAKLVDKKKPNEDVLSKEINNQNSLVQNKKYSESNATEKSHDVEKIRRKKTIKSKNKAVIANNTIEKTLDARKVETIVESDPKAACKERKHCTLDPYDFETDSVSDLNNFSDSKNNSSSESESESVDSTKSSESTELSDTKKKLKRKRGRLWQVGVIKPKNRKKISDLKPTPTTTTETENRKLPDFTCFTDRTYCFRKHVYTYNCRICLYSGTDIVHHYKKEHPHTEVPLSRLSPAVAKEAIKESEDVNFQGISKLSSKKYVCRFCSKEFTRKRRLLESFFWHVVSVHTGEYKHPCSKCVNTQICPLNIDIPPPPIDANGQLLGYICEKCNYTQISLENLKTHVIVWHNDEQTAVYTINLAIVSKSALNHFLNKSEEMSAHSKQPRVLRSSRSSRSNLSMAEASDDEIDSTEEKNDDPKPKHDSIEPEADDKSINKICSIQSKITFESDITEEITNFNAIETLVKIEPNSNEIQDESQLEPEKQADTMEKADTEQPSESCLSRDIFDYAHFKIMYTETRSKVYVCCINGNDYHYKTSLLISMKKHVQLKHSEKWDGYCCLCKVIVTPQGQHKFKDCFQHFLEKHLDSFPVLDKIPVPNEMMNEKVGTNNSYINVRPLSDLVSNSSDPQPNDDSGIVLPVIESVMSLGADVQQPRPSSSHPTSTAEDETSKQYKYEEFQAVIMSRKHRVVLEAMMSHIKLVQVFKCAGRFCSFTTDSAEDALLHASTHMRVGGVDSLSCAYCDFDSSGNAIDLITHVFKYHGCCPYVCSMCYYRAAASQLVQAHIARVHDKATNVDILKTPFQTAAMEEDNFLSREEAVPYYFCYDKTTPDDPCKFKTYTPGKFCEHLQLRHASSKEFQCFICSQSTATPWELIRHIKTHGLKLYQCTWCVHGADDETELLEHSSRMHPTVLPKAYLRILTNKGRSSEFRVLPLAHLNKSDIPVIDVATNTTKDFPVREAERSVELEKLIGNTNLVIESIAAETSGGQLGTEEEEPQQDNISILENTDTLIPRAVTPVPTAMAINQSEQTTPIIKAEILELTPEKIPQTVSEIVCLDSDDDNAPAIAGSATPPCGLDSEVATPVEIEMKKVPITELFLCSKCELTMKCGAGFRKHINACFGNTPDLIPCAHCPLSLPKKNMVTHYNLHCDRTKEPPPRYFCRVCSLGFPNIDHAKEHQFTHHRMDTKDSAVSLLKVASGPKNRRKRSLENREKAIEPPEKLKRFGPQDIDKLPINPILDDSVVCSLCEFSTKVRLNMVRHLQLHGQQQPVPQTAPVNPVPHLETNEKHFDRMVNLASSSVRPVDKANKSDNYTSVTLTVPPDTVTRYPKYVSDKQRLTCGAKDCSYTSVDESMLKCHWETLHYGTNDFHCVHCPSYQHLDKSKPLTALRILAHLKMHDDKLYACSQCAYYHYRRQLLEKHLAESHKGGQVLIVREGTAGESSTPTAATASLVRVSAPTMDLKPWQCGLCKFKSLLRPEVAEHCAKVHNSKMQFKCAYCAFRTSNPENITKHQSKSHMDKPEEIFYYYYREGSVPNDTDGTTRWEKQSQNTAISEPKVKTEDPSDIPPSSSQTIPINPIDLNLVKKEIEPIEETIEELCNDFGEFCEPNGLKYKCSLCNNVVEDSLEAMRSHLYEELKYRKWGCSICSYKAFHTEGLGEHMQTEHRQNRDPIALPIDNRVETWVAKLLEHQTALITTYKENLAKQKQEILRSNPGPSPSKTQTQQASELYSLLKSKPLTTSIENKFDDAKLENIFGSFGASSNLGFCCPKCNSSFKEEQQMHSHMESELNKIRWYCSKCSMKFQTYHEAQFHSRSVHIGQGARPVEVTRDAAVRAAWVAAVITSQKKSMNLAPEETSRDSSFNQIEDMSEPSDNSLLVVRFEKNIQTAEEEIAHSTSRSALDSDDEKLIIDEPLESRATKPLELCPHCTYANGSEKIVRAHILRHYGLKPFMCPYCDLNGTRKTIEKHQILKHPQQPIHLVPAAVPLESPSEYCKKSSNAASDSGSAKVLCLVCRNYFTETESATHTHDKVLATFGKKGDVVVQCSICHSLHKDVNTYLKHHKFTHPELAVNYVFTKLNTLSTESKELLYACAICPQKFSQIKDIKSHAEANHQALLKYTLVPKHNNAPVVDSETRDKGVQEGSKRKSHDDAILPPTKKTARKSTTKLPPSTCARKSTTKLPCNVVSETEERSWYGTQPTSEGLKDVVAMMPFCNKVVPFAFNKLNDIININPLVVVEKKNT